MKQLLIISVILVLSVPVCGQSHPDHQRVNQQLKQMQDAFNANDMAKVASFYTDDAQITGTTRVQAQGRQALDQYWLWMKDKGRGWQLTTVETGGTGELIYQVGTSDLKLLSDDKTEKRFVTHFILLWKKQTNGEYRIYRDFLTNLDFSKLN